MGYRNHVGFSLIICWQMSENGEINAVRYIHTLECCKDMFGYGKWTLTPHCIIMSILNFVMIMMMAVMEGLMDEYFILRSIIFAYNKLRDEATNG